MTIHGVERLTLPVKVKQCPFCKDRGTLHYMEQHYCIGQLRDRIERLEEAARIFDNVFKGDPQ